MLRDRVVLHADLDAFYASVEQRDRPELRGRPVVIGGTSSRGVVSAASYEARRSGVHSAMPMFEARRLCPDAVVLRGDMRRYQRESRRVFEIFHRFTPLVEGLSLDEAYLDLTGSARLLGSARAVAERLRASVRSEIGLVLSVGIGPSKLVAKIASDLAKPDGLLEVALGDAPAFLAPLPVWRLWGVGRVVEAKLASLGFRTIDDLVRADPRTLVRRLGPGAERWIALARGDDERAVVPERRAVSLSEESTFAEDVSDRARLARVLTEHADAVARRLRASGLRGRTVVIKLKLARRVRAGPRGYPLLTRRTTLDAATDGRDAIVETALALLDAAGEIGAVRLVGVGVSGLEEAASAEQPGLFDDARQQRVRRSARLDRALDTIRDRFGAAALVRGEHTEIERAGLSLQHKRGERDPRDEAEDE